MINDLTSFVSQMKKKTKKKKTVRLREVPGAAQGHAAQPLI